MIVKKNETEFEFNKDIELITIKLNDIFFYQNQYNLNTDIR